MREVNGRRRRARRNQRRCLFKLPLCLQDVQEDEQPVVAQRDAIGARTLQLLASGDTCHADQQLRRGSPRGGRRPCSLNLARRGGLR
jgi:hypothetical protein